SSAFADEMPSHQVDLEAFYIGKTEVTNAQFRRFVQATGYRTTAEKEGSACVWSDEGGWEKQWDVSWRTMASEWGEEAPVTCVSWDDARAYCRWAGLRLPTEAEWEKAARGTDGRRYPWGNRWDASRCQNSAGGPLGSAGRPRPVGSFPPGASPWGALDMAGNVAEWCSSRYQPYPYRAGDGRESAGGDPDSRVYRGGSWYYNTPAFFRTADREAEDPGERYSFLGFRCALSASEGRR
ncbi:MAG TPA: SUMF1/EgtB/PvdO family nonheme iron enzyme, partial [Candidatus Nitrosotenuis sp.]|nr:SUMF1/EgtB/PvdO family nonheme iron enzyme [Candidatus Nitrosotenuis sp.]